MLDVRILSALAGVGTAMLLSRAASATFTGLSVVATTHAIGAADPGAAVAWQGQTITTYQIFAMFNNAGDALTSVFGNVPNPLTIQIRNASDSGPGTTFFNNSFGANLAPNSSLYGTSPSLQWDTYLSIGVEPTPPVGVDTTAFSIGFFGGPSVNTPFSMDTGITGGTNHAWYVLGPIPQGTAGADLRVMLAQFSVHAGENIRGTLNLTYRPFGATSDLFVTASGSPSLMIFNTVPAPAALALFGLAGLFASRRRRT